MRNMQKGFSIVSAIFLLVVLAFLGTAMMTFSTNQQQTSALDVLGSRAYQASRAGIEWGAYQVLPNSAVAGGFAVNCRNAGGGAVSSVLPAMAGTLSGFNVTVSCAATAHSDASAATGTVWMYQLTSTAAQGAAGAADYVERQVQASIAQ